MLENIDEITTKPPENTKQRPLMASPHIPVLRNNHKHRPPSPPSSHSATPAWDMYTRRTEFAPTRGETAHEWRRRDYVIGTEELLRCWSRDQSDKLADISLFTPPTLWPFFISFIFISFYFPLFLFPSLIQPNLRPCFRCETVVRGCTEIGLNTSHSRPSNNAPIMFDFGVHGKPTIPNRLV